jgi:hypothetical protein
MLVKEYYSEDKNDIIKWKTNTTPLETVTDASNSSGETIISRSSICWN